MLKTIFEDEETGGYFKILSSKYNTPKRTNPKDSERENASPTLGEGEREGGERAQ